MPRPAGGLPLLHGVQDCGAGRQLHRGADCYPLQPLCCKEHPQVRLWAGHMFIIISISLISYMYYRFQLGIARKYRVAGRVSCCYTSGCNKDIFSAMGSVETQAVPSPSEAFQTRPLLQVRDFKNMEINLCILFISGSKYWKHKKWVNITQVFLDSMVFKLIQYFHFFIFLLALMNKDYIIIHLSFFWVIQLYLSIISWW